MNPHCECDGPGFCQRHGAHKTMREYELCAGINCTPVQCQKYFSAWEECRMPNQDCSLAGEQASRGLGDRLARAIQRVSRGRVKPCGGCKQRAAKLNHWFPDPQIPPVSSVTFNPPIRRNLLYHIYPLRGNGVWQRNVHQLLQRIELFNHRRVVAIVTDRARCDPPELVQEMLADHVEDFIVSKNVKRLREVVTFVPLLERVESLDPNEVTFYGHTKGVTKPLNEGVTVHRWADAMYATCLDHWPVVQAALENKAMAGSFRRYGQFKTPGNFRWHYSGSFYWFRNRDVFRRNWRYVDRSFFGVESWPGHLFPPEETACLFHDDTENLYEMNYWMRVVQPRLDQWQIGPQEVDA